MTLKQVYEKACRMLESGCIVNSSLEARMILLYILKLDHKEFILNFEKMKVNIFKRMFFFHKIKKRLSGISIAYLIHKKYFYDSEIYVNRSVLIPRPETELLIDIVLAHIETEKFYNILDVGTGSGNIAVELAKKIKNVKIDALDKSFFSLVTASRNIILNQIGKNKIRLCKKNFLKYRLKKKYDIIISNPPYIESDIVTGLLRKKEVSDPRRTLDGGDDGLKFYYKLKEAALKNLTSGGFMLFEHGFNQREKILSIFSDNCFQVKCFKDLNNLDRAMLIFVKG